MQIRMLKTEAGSIDGIRVATYIEGEQYDLGATDGTRELAAAFIASGRAVGLDAASADEAGQLGSEQASAGSEAGEPEAKKRPGRKPKAE